MFQFTKLQNILRLFKYLFVSFRDYFINIDFDIALKRHRKNKRIFLLRVYTERLMCIALICGKLSWNAEHFIGQALAFQRSWDNWQVSYITAAYIYHRDNCGWCMLFPEMTFKTLGPEQYGRQFAGDIRHSKHILSLKKIIHLDSYSIGLVRNGSIKNKSPLIRVMGWHGAGDSLLPETMLTQFIDLYNLF